jgi:hypothetical protein
VGEQGITVLPSASGTTPASRRKKGSFTEVTDVRRQVKHYSISQTEMVGLGISETFGGGLLGWGVNMSTVWAGCQIADPNKAFLGWTSALLLVAGGVFLLTPIALLVFVKRSSPD